MPCGIPNPSLTWLQAGEFATGGAGGNSTGVLNRPLIQLLANDVSLKNCVDALEIQVQNALGPGAMVTNIINTVWPVGSLYINADNPVHPGILYGVGTWVKYGEGRVMIGDGTTTDINGVTRFYDKTSVTTPGTAKTFNCTITSYWVSGNGYYSEIDFPGLENVGAGYYSTVAQVATALCNNRGWLGNTAGIVNITSVGAVLTLHMAIEAGDAPPPVLTASRGYGTVSALTVSQAYVPPIFGVQGGEFRHQLIPPELPSNTMQQTIGYNGTSYNVGRGDGNTPAWNTSFDTQTGISGGSNLPHNNVQPHVVAYMFKRTA